jgi:hypothetical protein
LQQTKKETKALLNMEKDMTIRNASTTESGLESLVNTIAKALRQPMHWLRNYYSQVCNRPISMHQTHLLLEAQVAFVLAVFGFGGPLLLHVGFALWFLYAVVKCKIALGQTEEDADKPD